jgi:hypothetical protein
MPSRPHTLAVRFSLASGLAAAALTFGATGAAADCSGGRPCITKLVPVPKTQTHGGSFMLRVHWSSACKYDKFHFSMGQEHSPTEIGGNRNQLCNQRSHTFLLTSAHRGQRIRVSVQGCESRLVGKDACTPFSQPMSVVLISDQHSAACRTYASRAVGAVKMARDTYKCDPKVISGPRWSPNFEEHRTWCETAEPKTANFEDKERTRIMHQCRVDAAKGPPGKPALNVTSQGGDTFFVNVSGFPPNVPVIIRLSGPGASIASVTSTNNQRIVANAQGAVSVRLFGAQICKRGGGTVIFTAEDQDGRKSPPATAKCAP